MKIIQAMLVIAALTLPQLTRSSAVAAVVYDSISGGLSTGGLGCCTNGLGQSVTLAGNERYVHSFDVWLGSMGPSTFTIEFYQPNGSTGAPGALIWQSAIQNYPYTSSEYNRKVVNVNVPLVQVPSTFVWILTTIERNNNILLTSSPPTVGVRNQSWRRSNGEWISGDSPFGARVLAVETPEPGSGLLLLLGLAMHCGLAGRSTRRR